MGRDSVFLQEIHNSFDLRHLDTLHLAAGKLHPAKCAGCTRRGVGHTSIHGSRVDTWNNTTLLPAANDALLFDVNPSAVCCEVFWPHGGGRQRGASCDLRLLGRHCRQCPKPRPVDKKKRACPSRKNPKIELQLTREFSFQFVLGAMVTLVQMLNVNE